MVSMAHTIVYDLEILAGTQDGKPLPAERWRSVTADCLVMVGGRSETFFHSGAKALACVLSRAEYRVWPRQGHSAVLMAAKDLAELVRGFFVSTQCS